MPENDSIADIVKETNESSIAEALLDTSLAEQNNPANDTIVKTENEIKRPPPAATPKKKKVVKKNFNVEAMNNNTNNNSDTTSITASTTNNNNNKTPNPARPFSSSSARVMSAKSGSASIVEKVGLDSANNPTAPSSAATKPKVVKKSNDGEVKSVKIMARKKKVAQS